jgi:hypothetical protein
MKLDNKKFLFALAFFMFLMVLYVYKFNNNNNNDDNNNNNNKNNKQEESIPVPFPVVVSECKDSYTPCSRSEETKALSKSLNTALMQIGRLSCESSKDDVSSHGGWCSKFSGKNSTLHLTDTSLATEFSKYLRGKNVASFGDGPGAYKAFISNLKQVNTYDAYDGAPYADITTDGHVKHLDLSAPVYHLPVYDWIISLEVAEHVPKEFEQIFIDNLTRHAKEGIILSWAVVGQLGHSHVNNQNPPYVKEQLENRGFKLDQSVTDQMKNAASFPWLKRNIYVYTRV